MRQPAVAAAGRVVAGGPGAGELRASHHPSQRSTLRSTIPRAAGASVTPRPGLRRDLPPRDSGRSRAHQWKGQQAAALALCRPATGEQVVADHVDVGHAQGRSSAATATPHRRTAQASPRRRGHRLVIPRRSLRRPRRCRPVRQDCSWCRSWCELVHNRGAVVHREAARAHQLTGAGLDVAAPEVTSAVSCRRVLRPGPIARRTPTTSSHPCGSAPRSCRRSSTPSP